MINKQELIKDIVQVGNSAGVILPREWLNGRAKVSLLEEPLNIKKDILNILESHLEHVLGIYIAGSYARDEQTAESDVDVLVITDKINKKIKKGKYDISLISLENLENALKTGIIPLLPMLKEARPILNGGLIEGYKKTKLTKSNTKAIIELTRSSLNVNKGVINLTKEREEGSNVGTSYSLILSLRTLYILDCLKKNKKWSTGELKKMIKKITGSMRAYEGYLIVKNDKKGKSIISLDEAQKLYNYLDKKLEEWARWLREKKD